MLRILRLARIFRIAKISRSYLTAHVDAKTQADMNKINIVIYFLAITTVTVLFGSLFYIIENPAKGYTDIPSSMLNTLMILIGGIGYSPVDATGEIVVIIVRFIGLALFGFMVSITSGIINQWLLGSKRSK